MAQEPEAPPPASGAPAAAGAATAAAKGVRKKSKRLVVDGIAHIHSTFNNTIVTITDRQGTQIQRKLGPYIDTFLSSMLMSQIDGRASTPARESASEDPGGHAWIFTASFTPSATRPTVAGSTQRKSRERRRSLSTRPPVCSAGQ